MIVTQSAIPARMCDRASHQPASTSQSTFASPEGSPAPGFDTRVRPNGHSEYEASRSEATPKGMVTTRTKQIRAAMP